jgi:hypothetical protein
MIVIRASRGTAIGSSNNSSFAFDIYVDIEELVHFIVECIIKARSFGSVVINFLARVLPRGIEAPRSAT